MSFHQRQRRSFPGTIQEVWEHLIAADEEEEMNIEGIHVVVKAAWKWMISE